VIQKHFPAGETGPVTLLLTAKTDWSSPEGRALVAQLSRGFRMLENVAEVRSLTQPLGVPLADAGPAPGARQKGWAGLFNALKTELDGAVGQWTADASRKHYVGTSDGPDGRRHVTRIDVCLRTDPFALESVKTLEVLELWMSQIVRLRPLPGDDLKVDYHGVTVHSRDMARVIEGDRMRVNLLVLAGVFLILVLLVRRLWLSGYLLGTVLLSYYATLGATAVFAAVLWGRPFGQIEWRVPFFLFTILVAVGEDYNILMVTRVLQERKRRGVLEGLRRGLARTGGTVTACGLIMAGTFGTLMLAELSTLVQVGFALAFGVLLDTFVVRALLVPTFLQLVWQDRDDAADPPAPDGPVTLAFPRRGVRRVG
jgi:RND superfamily putative drug exporter